MDGFTDNGSCFDPLCYKNCRIVSSGQIQAVYQPQAGYQGTQSAPPKKKRVRVISSVENIARPRGDA